MFVLLDIEHLANDLESLSAEKIHKLTFRVAFTIKDVPDTFTGIVYENGAGELQVEHFNNPKGNKRKVITLKNKLPAGAFDKVKGYLYAVSCGETVSYPLELESLNKRISGTPRK